MKILFIVGSCLSVNSSANLCHRAYIQGAIASGHECDVIAVSPMGMPVDGALVNLKVRKEYLYRAAAYSRLANSFKSQKSLNSFLSNKNSQINYGIIIGFKSFMGKTIRFVKNGYLKSLGVYGLDYLWFKRARWFKTEDCYDIVISLSSPVIGHELAARLLSRGRLRTKRWVQIWEDPWYVDLYNTRKNEVKLKESNLVALPDEVIYVTPITLRNQQSLYPLSARKMRWLPLPYYYKDNSDIKKNALAVSYLGDYFSYARNLVPFYNAVKKLNYETMIVGNSDLCLKNTKNIKVMPRVGITDLKIIERGTTLLVMLCNLGGGQIPGKIYQYAATKKYVLFILDGTEEEKAIIYNYFSKFNRFVFCDNNIKDISNALKKIYNKKVSVDNSPVDYFSPKNIFKEIVRDLYAN